MNQGTKEKHTRVPPAGLGPLSLCVFRTTLYKKCASDPLECWLARHEITRPSHPVLRPPILQNAALGQRFDVVRL